MNAATWAYEPDVESLGLCPYICPDHHRHCDIGPLNHPFGHACVFCIGWDPHGWYGATE